MLAHLSVHEPKPPDDPDSPLAYSMEGAESEPPAPLISRYWSPGWNSVQALNKFQQETGGQLRGGDPGKRLIEPSPAPQVPFFPAPPHPGTGAVTDPAPHYDLFGSEELSAQAPGIVRRREWTKP
jgi:NADH-quinone oxidoreductase subunit G